MADVISLYLPCDSLFSYRRRKTDVMWGIGGSQYTYDKNGPGHSQKVGVTVTIGDHKPKWTSMTCGVRPQGSVLLLINMFVLQLSQIIIPHKMMGCFNSCFGQIWTNPIVGLQSYLNNNNNDDTFYLYSVFPSSDHFIINCHVYNQ